MSRNRYEENFLDGLEDGERWVFTRLCPKLARGKLLFMGVLDTAFEPDIERGRFHNDFNWPSVKKFFNDAKNDLTNFCALRIFCAFVINLFYMFDCKHDTFLMKFIYMYHQVINHYETWGFCDNCMRLNYPRHYPYEDLESARRILKEVNEMRGDCYRFTNRELYSKLTTYAIYEGDCTFLQFLVKYGLSYFPVDELHQARVELEKLGNAYGRLKSLERYDNEMSERNFAESVVQQLLTDVENPSIRRLILIVRYLNICLRRCLKDNYYPEYVTCLNWYVLTLPEAAISVKDVCDFLNSTFPYDRAFITEMSSDFQEVFPGSPSRSSPRSLQHLCRCTVRKSIQKRSSLPSMLSDVRIPRKIKDYLLILSN